MSVSSLNAEAGSPVFSLVPQFLAPQAPLDAEGDGLYGFGGGGRLGISLDVTDRDILSVHVDAGFDRIIAAFTGDPLNIARIGVGPGLTLSGSRVGARLSGTFGYYYGFYGANTGGNLFWDSSVAVIFRISGPLTIFAEGGWRDYPQIGNSSSPFLARIPFAGIGVSFEPSAVGGRSKVLIDKGNIQPIFPSLLKYYAANPLGVISVVNGESYDLSSVEVSFFMPSYMDSPTTVATLPVIARGQRANVDLAAIFNPKILSVTEGTVSQAEVTVSWVSGGHAAKVKKTYEVKIYDRGATLWDDDRKAAAFVTTKDQSLLTFAKNSSASLAKTKGLTTDKNLQTAIVMLEALSLYGIQYSPDPSSPYGSAASSSIDFLQYPAQTLQFKSGDCDDLTILYCALLESVGVETAMITTPGHIFAAVALSFPETDVATFFTNPGDCIVASGRVWLPIETTLLRKGFSVAWKQGSRDWAEASKTGSGNLWPVHDSWEMYEPVGFIEGSQTPSPVDASRLVQNVVRENGRVVDAIVLGGESSFKKRIENAKAGLDRAREQNKLGIYYARLGLTEKALAEFEKAKASNLLSAEINIANLRLSNELYDEAIKGYQAILAKDAKNKSALYGLAQAAAFSNRQELAEETLSRLSAIDADLASRVSGVVKSASGREANRGGTSVTWEEK
jgi:hypothetical protein